MKFDGLAGGEGMLRGVAVTGIEDVDDGILSICPSEEGAVERLAARKMS